MIPDPYQTLRERVLDSVLRGPGESDPGIRIAVADRKNVPADLQPLVDKIHRHAYKVTDEDIAAAQMKHGDDKMFEIVVSAALGASNERLAAGLKALEEA